MSRAGGRRLAVRAVLALTLVAAAWTATAAMRESVNIWRHARRYAHEPLERAQDRLFGRDYMEAIRAIRDRVPADASLELIDAQSAPRGATYFVLHYLAPRRIRRVGSTRDEPWRRLAKLVRRDASWVVVVGDLGQPPSVEPAWDFRRRILGAR